MTSDPANPLARFTPRDLRRTIKTRLSEVGVLKEVRDRVQNHALHDVASKHYDRFDYLPDKRAALEGWQWELRRILASRPASDDWRKWLRRFVKEPDNDMPGRQLARLMAIDHGARNIGAAGLTPGGGGYRRTVDPESQARLTITAAPWQSRPAAAASIGFGAGAATAGKYWFDFSDRPYARQSRRADAPECAHYHARGLSACFHVGGIDPRTSDPQADGATLEDLLFADVDADTVRETADAEPFSLSQSRCDSGIADEGRRVRARRQPRSMMSSSGFK